MSMAKTNLSTELLVANSILSLSFEKGHSISPMKLQKLMYFVYKRYLKQNRRSLFDEYFQVWQYGPVLPSIYHEFKDYKARGITDYAYSDFDENRNVFVISESSRDFHEALEFVWGKYRNYDGIELSELTHRDNTAWDRALRDKILNLPDEYIEEEEWLT